MSTLFGSLLAAGLVLASCLASPAVAQERNLLSLGAGATLVAEPASHGGWGAVHLLDDVPGSGWACERGHPADNAFVFEVPAPTTFATFAFDTGRIDTAGSGAGDVVVEVSASATSGFQPVLRARLEDRLDDQRFAAQAKVEGRFVRLVIANNHGEEEWTELMGFRGYGTQAAPDAIGDLSGTYDTDYSAFHLRQQGTALSGCYEYKEGVFEGTVEGRVVRLTWTESGQEDGPAVFVFSPDGQTFRGTWWRETDKDRPPNGAWDGTRSSTEVGTCPHWSGSLSGELRKDLAATGRATLYGILFDTDKDVIRDESLPTLDQVVALMAEEPTWRLTIEGHTDSTGSAPHNQTLSEQRAASVKAYLVSKGVAAERLATAGFGASRPVADNGTELGRSKNRRVELVRQ